MQDYLGQTLKRRFIKAGEWPPSSLDVNPLDYFFWDLVKIKVYGGRMGQPFATDTELKAKIKAVWKECASNLPAIRKATDSLFRDYEL